MSIVTPLRLRTIRRVSFTDEGVTVTDSADSWFRGDVTPPRTIPTPSVDSSPRDSANWKIRWSGTMFGPGALAPANPGDRVEDDNTIYELTSVPQELTVERRVIGYEVAAMPINFLYPIFADLKDMGGNTLVNTIPLAVYTPSGDHNNQGSYENTIGEVPVEFEDEMKENRVLRFGGRNFKLTSAVVPPLVPHVRVGLRAVRI